MLLKALMHINLLGWDAVNFNVSQSGKWIEEFTGPLYTLTMPPTGPADLKVISEEVC